MAPRQRPGAIPASQRITYEDGERLHALEYRIRLHRRELEERDVDVEAQLWFFGAESLLNQWARIGRSGPAALPAARA